MFEKTLRTIRQLEQGTSITVHLPHDEKGYLDRRCPSPECGKHFKVDYQDWKEKIHDKSAFCPYCRFPAGGKQWDTDEQREHIRAVGLAHIRGIIDQALEADAHAYNAEQRSRPRNGLIDISMTMEFKAGPRPVIVPPAVAEALRQDFVCTGCGCRWSSLGSTFFCPVCGDNSAAVMFERTAATVRNVVAQLDVMVQTFGDPDAAQDAARQIVEDQLGRLVGAFERLSEALADRIPTAQQASRKGAVFQRIDDASAWWQQSVGVGYDTWLQPAEIARLKVLYQRRHLLIHCQGIVDQSYLTKAGDPAYQLGQRIVVRSGDVAELAGLLERLGAGIASQLRVPPATQTVTPATAP